MKHNFALFTFAAGVLLAGSVSAAPTLTGATLFDSDASGTNLSSSGGVADHGAWTTVLDQQNVPGNYGGELFLATTSTPSPSQFLTPAASTSIALHAGANTLYFWGDGDDTLGGTYGFGFNIYLNGAASSSPGISALAVPGAGPAAVADGSGGCTPGYDFVCTPGAGTLSAGKVTLTNFQVYARGGGTGGEDLVNSTNTMPFTPPPHPDGVNDTWGTFTLVYTPGVPEPAGWSLMLAGLAGVGAVTRSRRKRGEARAVVR